MDITSIAAATIKFTGIIKSIKSVFDFIATNKNIQHRFLSSIDYHSLYGQIKNPNMGYLYGKKYKLKKVFFSNFALVQTPLSLQNFNLNWFEDQRILSLDGIIDSNTNSRSHNGYQLPVYSYKGKFLEDNFNLGYIYQSPSDISLKLFHIDKHVLHKLKNDPIIVVKYPSKFISKLNTIIDCVVEVKPIVGMNFEIQDPYKKYILEKTVNFSDYGGFYLEIVGINNSELVEDEIKIKFDVIIKAKNEVRFENKMDKLQYALGNISQLQQYKKIFPFELSSFSFSHGNIPKLDNYIPPVSTVYTSKESEFFINYYNQENMLQFGKITTLKNYSNDVLKLNSQINNFTKRLKTFQDLKSLNFETVITSDGNSHLWNKILD